ncbi:MAG TPA: M23 family metallopeptidase [Gemmatimonadales bacterium]|nr:M23 family metallopeptidase [Gemmatimonadales bacterium]
MGKRRWTVVLVPHGSEPSKIVEVSYSALRLAAGIAAGVVALLCLVGYATLSRSVDLSRTAGLQSENARLAVQLGELDQRVRTLSDTLERIAERDARIRTLANLDPIDPQVQAAGIGGPAVATPAADGALERRATAVRFDLSTLIRRANLLARSFRDAADSLASHADRLAATPSIMPTQGWLSSEFSRSRFHPILHTARAHEGIDVSAPMGTPILAPGAGVVRQAGRQTGYGLAVTIDHGYGIETKFAHASKLLVRPGQRVKRGTPIALVGNSGLSTGPHLHYEVHVNGRPVNPLQYVLPEVITD